MFGLVSLVPFLLAASPATNNISPVRSIIQEADALYRDLQEAGISKHYSPTVKFSFVNPPNEKTASSSWRDSSSTDVDEHDLRSDSCLFEQVANKHGYSKPLALYLPGLDGFGISGAQQFDDLASTFELWRMTMSTSDRSSFAQLTEAVANFIRDVASPQNRDVILIGESFGGLLAPGVAMRAQSVAKRTNTENPIKSMVLVNPATSFEDTEWSTLAPLLTSLANLETTTTTTPSTGSGGGRASLFFPTPYSVVGGLTLSALVPDSNQFQRIQSLLLGMSVTTANDIADLLASMGDGFGILGKQLPAQVVQHRVSQWLPVGSSVVNPRLSTLDLPTLVIAGQDDNMLPSQKEADRLVKVMPSCQKLEVKGSGHFVLDDRVNLTQAILSFDLHPFLEKKKPHDPITDWELPSQDEIRNVVETRVEPLRRLTSPVFFSTDKNGKRWKGLSHLPSPSDGPIVFVANHQFGGLDLGMIIAQLVEDRNIAARGLAHPVIFQSQPGNGDSANDNNSLEGVVVQQSNTDGSPFDNKLFRKFGAVMVTPRNYYRLMQTGQTALLFPGGTREVFHGKDEAYQLFWPEKVDFVRTAAKFNATVVPLSAVGAADSVNILIDAPDMARLPFGIGERVLNSSANTMAARFNVDNENELFVPPFSLPKGLPARHYFVFGKPMSTGGLDHRDKEGCEQFYSDVKEEMMRGFDDVLQAREKDPWKDSLQRIAFEQVTRKQAPTFSVDELNH